MIEFKVVEYRGLHIYELKSNGRCFIKEFTYCKRFINIEESKDAIDFELDVQ